MGSKAERTTEAPLILEPAVAPIIWGDAIQIEIRPNGVWCHVLTKHYRADGEFDFHRQAIIAVDYEALADAMERADLARVRPSGQIPIKH